MTTKKSEASLMVPAAGWWWGAGAARSRPSGTGTGLVGQAGGRLLSGPYHPATATAMCHPAPSCLVCKPLPRPPMAKPPALLACLPPTHCGRTSPSSLPTAAAAPQQCRRPPPPWLAPPPGEHPWVCGQAQVGAAPDKPNSNKRREQGAAGCRLWQAGAASGHANPEARHPVSAPMLRQPAACPNSAGPHLAHVLTLPLQDLCVPAH